MVDQHDERRRYFRVTDLVGMNFRLLSEGERELALNSQPTSLKNLLSEIEEQIDANLLSLKNSSPELHKLLALYNQKINLAFGHGIANKEHDSGHSVRACKVNLSACGIAFPCPESAQLNQHMVLELTLYPSNVCLQLFAAVIACEDYSEHDEEDKYLIRADFVNITDADQELLVQHVIKRQAQQLKDLREQKKESE